MYIRQSDRAPHRRAAARAERSTKGPYLYSNNGYVLLSLVVERATGTTLAAYSKTRIFEPLGMGDTQYRK
jgi:CubicO group peptidase (beta-lactamase class C family)